MSLALLLTTATATVVGAAALHAAHGLRRQVAALRVDLAVANGTGPGASVPQARSGMTQSDTRDEIRTAVAEALAEERERELAEARAFWAAQEARDAADAPSMLGGLTGPGTEDVAFYMPRQADFAGLESVDAVEPLDHEQAGPLDDLVGPAFPSLHGLGDLGDLGADLLDDETDEEAAEQAGFAEDSPELAAARRRHPSHPDFVPVRTPVVTDHERTVARLGALAETRTVLSDVRPGPLGTLDVYVFADGTTLCMTPGHRETAERLATSLRDGGAPYLLGGSGVSGAYSLTFACGAGPEDDEPEHVYVLADRVIASL